MVLVWSVGLVVDRKCQTVSTAKACGCLVGVTFTVWKVCSAGFSKVLANITSSRENLSNHLVSKAFMSLSISAFV